MADATYKEGKLWGKDRDPTLKLEGLRGLDDERLGKLLRAMGKTAAVYRESEHSANCPPLDFGRERTVEEVEERTQESQKFRRHMNVVNGFISKVITGAIYYSNIDNNRMAMHSKSAIFKEGEPVLYWEHWGTDDLDEADRDSVELQVFVGLNDYLQTEAGKTLARNVLNEVLDGSMISPSEVPSDMHTFGTVPEDVFAPFIRPSKPTPWQ